MITSRFAKMLAVSGLLGTASMLSSGSALAWYQWYHYYPRGDDFGNGNFGAGWHWYGYDESNEFTNSSGRTRASVASQSFYVQAHALGVEVQPISVYAAGRGSQNNLNGATTYASSAYADLYVLGNQVFFSNPANNGTAATSFDKSISQTLFNVSFPVWVGPVLVTVSGSVDGAVHAGLSAQGTSLNLAHRGDNFFGAGQASLSSGAYVEAHLRGDASFIGLVGLYVTPSFKLIDVELSPSTRSDQIVIGSGRPSISWSNLLPFRISTLDGSVDVGVSLLFQDVASTNLINWQGWTVYQQNIVDDHGSVTL